MASATNAPVQTARPAHQSTEDDGVWYVIGFIFCIFLVWWWLWPARTLRAAWRVNAAQAGAIRVKGVPVVASLQPATATHSTQQHASQQQTAKAAELKVPTRAADVIRTGVVSDTQTLHVRFYFLEGVIAQVLLTRNGTESERKYLPLVKVQNDLSELAHMKMLVNRLKGDDIPAVMYAAESVPADDFPVAIPPQEMDEPPLIPYEDDGCGEPELEPLPATSARVLPINQPRMKNFRPSGDTEPIRVLEGKFVESGPFPRQGAQGQYMHFGIKILDRNNVEECAFGVDLMRCLKDSGAEPGDLVRMEQLRSSPIVSGEGAGKSKNIWKMTVVQPARASV